MATGQDDGRHSFNNNTLTPFDCENIQAEREQFESEQQAELEAELAADSVSVPVDEPGTVEIEVAGEFTRKTEAPRCPTCFRCLEDGHCLPCDSAAATRAAYESHFAAGQTEPETVDPIIGMIWAQPGSPALPVGDLPVGQFVVTKRGKLGLIIGRSKDGTKTHIQAQTKAGKWARATRDGDYLVHIAADDLSEDSRQEVLDSLGKRIRKRVEESQPQFLEHLEASKQAVKTMIKDVAERGALREFVLVDPLPEDDGLHRVHRKGCQDVPKDADLCFEVTVNDPDRNLLPWAQDFVNCDHAGDEGLTVPEYVAQFGGHPIRILPCCGVTPQPGGSVHGAYLDPNDDPPVEPGEARTERKPEDYERALSAVVGITMDTMRGASPLDEAPVDASKVTSDELSKMRLRLEGLEDVRATLEVDASAIRDLRAEVKTLRDQLAAVVGKQQHEIDTLREQVEFQRGAGILAEISRLVKQAGY